MLTVTVSSSKAGSLIIKDAEASKAPRDVLVAKEVEGMCGLGVEVGTHAMMTIGIEHRIMCSGNKD
jgi:hypothetical protein